MLFINHSEIPGKGIVIIEVNGPLNAATSPDFEAYIDRLAENDLSYVIFDAGGLEYVSSAGIGVMLYVQKNLGAKDGYFIICGLPGEVRTLFGLLGFLRILNLADSREDAIMMMEERTRAAGGAGIPLEELTLSDQEAVDEEARDFHAMEEQTSPQPADPHSGTAVSHEADDFENPLIVECAECRGLIRVKRSGTYQCPYCNSEFVAEKDGTIIF